jgi:hypothetical protein
LKTKQQPDGGFEQTTFAGFETTDAVLAIAEQAQTTSTWSTTEARDAIDSLHFGGTPNGKTPIDYLVDLTGTATDQGVAAKNLVLVALPLGFDPTDFGGVDLVTRMGGCSGDQTLGFNGLMYLAIAQELVCGGALPANLTTIRDGQQANGGWNFAGNPTLSDIDADSTATATEALIGGGAASTDPAVQKAMAFLATNQQATGAWQSFGTDDPNSTALAMLGIAAAGYDPSTSCWRDTVAPQLAGTPYANPAAWLRSQQITSGADAGRFQSPNDSFGVNTLATTQSVEALLRSWYPVFRADAQVCTTTGPSPNVSTTTPTAGGTITVSGDGFAPGATLTVELHSDPVLLATVVADGNGAYSAVVTIPADTAPGPHQIVVSGTGADGQPRVSVVSIDVQAPAVAVGAEAVSLQPRLAG